MLATLYHFWLCPFSRAARLALHESGVEFELELEKTWERRAEFLALNPAGDVPVLKIRQEEGDDDVPAMAGIQSIFAYLAKPGDNGLIGKTMSDHITIRNLLHWFITKFDREVTKNLVGQKVIKRLLRSGTPNGQAIRAGHHNIKIHLDYIQHLLARQKWLAGDTMTLADLMAAAQLSCVDYLGDVPWNDYGEAKLWYAKIKSRPSFRPLLGEHIPGTPPADHYSNLDF
jgi:glutathione S-transferase